MNLTLLGKVQVSWEAGTPPRFRSQRTAALLGYLAAEQRPFTRDHLAALFWPDEEPGKGKANLRRELHNLAQILPGCWQTNRVEVAFVPGQGTAVDIYQFQQYEADGQWQAVADLIGGNFLEGIVLADNLEFETWLLGEQERLRQKSVNTLNQVINQNIQQAANKNALENARKLLQLTPWNETAHRQVILLLARSGQRGAALKQFKICQQILEEELGVEVSAETRVLYEHIRHSQTFALHNIPATTTPFIGREVEQSLLESWLDDPNIRLITITGVGGMGKTRLALSLAQSEAKAWENPKSGKIRFPDGIYFVRVAAINNIEQLITAVARALHFSVQESDHPLSQERLFNYLKNKQLLLILDNLDHLVEDIDIVTKLLQAAPKVQIVVTSRARLQLRGEQVLDLKGLDYDGGEAGSAAHLFLETAQRVQPDFQLNEKNSVNLSRICTLVEGMPLALELAASWVNTLSLADIAQEIERSLDFLETSVRDIPARHRSIRAVFDTSWLRLAPDEQIVYAQLSVFTGGFTREAAQKVCQVTLPLLSRLVNISLLQYDYERDRYQMHELLRQYASNKLSLIDRTEMHRRHLSYFAKLAVAQTNQSHTGHLTEFGLWEIEFDNLQIALDWSLQDMPATADGMKLVGALEDFWLSSRSYLSQAHQWLSGLISIEDSEIPLRTQAAAFRTMGRLEYLVSRRRQVGIKYCQQSLAILERLSDAKGQIITLCSLGQIERHDYNYDVAEDYYQQAYDLAIKIEDLWGLSTALHGQGALALQRGELDLAQGFVSDGLSYAMRLGDEGKIAHLLILTGMIAMEKQQWEKARSPFKDALEIYRRIDHIDGEKVALGELGEIARIERDYAEAEQLYSESLAIARDRGAPEGVSIALYNLSQALLMRGKLHQVFIFLNEGLALAREQKDSVHIQCYIDAYASLLASQSQVELAATLWGAVDAAIEARNEDLDIADRLQHDHFVSRAKTKADELAFQCAWQKGRQMTLDEAVILIKNRVDADPALY